MNMQRYYFVFCKDSLLLEQRPDGMFAVPMCEEPPTEVKPWTTILNVTPMPDGTPVCTYSIDNVPADIAPEHSQIVNCQSSNSKFIVPLRQSYYHLPERLYL